MNTLGKILVVLNLLFALVTGGFIVFSFATRFRYEQALENQRREVIASKGALEGGSKVLATLDAKYKNAVAERDKVKADFADTVLVRDAKLAEKDNEIDTKTKELEKAKVYLTKMQEEINRRNEEVKNLGIAIKKREETILDLEGKTRFFQAEAVSQKAKADSLQARNDQLQELNRIISVELAKSRVGAPAGTPSVKLPNQPNPPTSLVTGKVDRVEVKDPDTVLISVGSDHGLATNNTLYAYRLEPEATYLGMIRIVEVHHQSAVGRLERTSVSRRIPLRSGDKVSSDLKFR